MTQRVLVVDDDADVRSSLARALRRQDREVVTAADAESALAAVATHRPEVVLTDVRMPGMGGLELLEVLRERAPEVDVVVMTGFNDLPVVAAAMKEGAADMLMKPIELNHLARVLDRIARDREARRRGSEDAESAGPGPRLVGRDPRMVAIFKTVGRVAATGATVLIRGESGTGKELVARAIHASSDAASEPFVAVNCAALPPTLLETELFGHLKGSFTGAAADRLGALARAGGGTLFLDEIGDTSLDFQAKLLRVLQEREFTPVGADESRTMEARIIAATHRPLEERVERGEFREDLYYRLRVVEIMVPPLRERMGDVPLLARHLVKTIVEAMGGPPRHLSDGAVDALLAHDWPGNVRELENCLTRGVVMCTGSVIRPEDLVLGRPREGEPARLETLAEMERRHVARVLVSTEGNKSEAARVLDISRPRLDRMIEKYGIEV